MRIAPLTLFLGGSALIAAQAVDAKVQDDSTTKSTYFDGVKVPPLLALTAENIHDEINQTKYMVVKYGSPYCPHCIKFAPTYQTLYEYYHTSALPVGPGESPDTTATTFEEYYNIRFFAVDCIAQNDICTKYAIKAYPQTVLYKNGEARGSVKGNSNIAIVSNLIETALEAERPGTRPQNLLLPTPGANSRPVPENKTVEIATDESQKPIDK